MLCVKFARILSSGSEEKKWKFSFYIHVYIPWPSISVRGSFALIIEGFVSFRDRLRENHNFSPTGIRRFSFIDVYEVKGCL